MAIYRVQHPELNATFHGTVSSSGTTVRYRNVRYAIVPGRKRFARSELVTSYPPEVDCTKPGLGPVSCSPEMETALFKLPKDVLPQKPQEDEFDCLHLTIITPTQLSPNGKKHPVLFYIPGGANMSHEPKPAIMADHTRLVEASIKMGKPIVCVLVHYRVGLFGFVQLPVSLGAAGGNNGLYDQRNGLEWVKRFISGFGGDPGEVTAAGESAGAWGVDAHLQAKGSDGDPRLQYFKRAAMWSGSLNCLHPLPKDDCEQITRRCVESVGMTVDDLLTCSAEEVVRAMGGIRLSRLNGVEDGEFLETGTTFTKPGWVESIMIGDCHDEAWLYMRKYATVAVQKYIDVLKASGGTVADQLLELFPQIHPDSPYDKAVAGMIELGGYMYWFGFTRDLARAYKTAEKPVYVYSFDQANPWAHERGAHHAADLLYWFNGYELPMGDDQKVADGMMTALVRYVNGEAPWAEYREHEVCGFGPNGYVGMVDGSDSRRQHVLDVLQKAGMHLTWKIGDALREL